MSRRYPSPYRSMIAAAFGLLLVLPSIRVLADPIDDRANELLVWVAQKTGYSSDHVRMAVLILEPRTIQRIAYRGDKTDDPQPEALTVGQTIFLPQWFELGRHDAILVHELTHVLQFANDARFPCRGAKEKQAYEVQSEFVEETGIGQKPNEFALFLLNCTSYAVRYESEKISE